MARTSELSIEEAVKQFLILNPGKVEVRQTGMTGGVLKSILMTNTKPIDLIYPDGWTCNQGCFMNKRVGFAGTNEVMCIVKKDGSFWEDKYCIFPDEDL